MQNRQSVRMGRRNFIFGGTCGALAVSSPALLKAQTIPDDRLASPATQRNVSSFRVHDWRDHFDSLKGGVILSDTTSKMLQYWSEDESIRKIYPTSVPLSDDLTRLGYTTVVRKVEGPSWRPTPDMKKRNPDWPDFVGPGPDNPLGTHALYLSWQYYRIHGTNDTRKIGRKSSNGCIGLYNEQIEELFALAKVGTQVKLI